MNKQNELLAQCWFIFDHFISSDYQGAMDEEYARKINYMFTLIQEIGRPDLGVKVSDGIGVKDEMK
jgi:hypothetical protein